MTFVECFFNSIEFLICPVTFLKYANHGAFLVSLFYRSYCPPGFKKSKGERKKKFTEAHVQSVNLEGRAGEVLE